MQRQLLVVSIALLLLALPGVQAVAVAAPHDALLAAPEPLDVPPVNVTLYAEALCPYCAGFITDTLAPLMAQGFDRIIAFTYVAYGNAKRGADHQLRCQHGPAECRLNRVINCASFLYPAQYMWLPFVTCLEGAPREQREQWVDRCGEQAAMDPFVLHRCAEGAAGDALEREAEARTAALTPTHTYVPWVLVEGVPLGEDDVNLRQYVCVASAAGAGLPEACFAPPDPTPPGGGGLAEGQPQRTSLT